jgi:cytoskeletal protein CcmA (bactofilin family)
MAFGTKKETTARNVNTSDQSILAKDVVVKGEVFCTGLLRVEGKIEGSIKGSGEITVAESADLKADIEGRKVIILGKVEGNIKASESVELVATAKVFGDITTDKISIEEGAVFTGKCVTKAPEKPKPEESPSKKDTNSKSSVSK